MTVRTEVTRFPTTKPRTTATNRVTANRLPIELKEQIKVAARDLSVSANAFVEAALTEKLAAMGYITL
jgi:predicted HicB family RNase H-like nuclease